MTATPSYCLDTHPLIWYTTGQTALSASAKTLLDAVFSGKTSAYISSIVLLETFHLSLKHRDFIFPTFLKRLRLPTIHIVSVDQHILSCCYTLPKELDIHDRLIVATTKLTNTILITKDPIIQKTDAIRWIW